MWHAVGVMLCAGHDFTTCNLHLHLLDVQEAPKDTKEPVYKKDDFFDLLSCEALERSQVRQQPVCCWWWWMQASRARVHMCQHCKCSIVAVGSRPAGLAGCESTGAEPCSRAACSLRSSRALTMCATTGARSTRIRRRSTWRRSAAWAV
jgi:hypothetical protein